MKAETKTIIEIGTDDLKHLKTAIEKINRAPEKVGFDKKDSLSSEESAVIKKLNDIL